MIHLLLIISLLFAIKFSTAFYCNKNLKKQGTIATFILFTMLFWLFFFAWPIIVAGSIIKSVKNRVAN